MLYNMTGQYFHSDLSKGTPPDVRPKKSTGVEKFDLEVNMLYCTLEGAESKSEARLFLKNF